MQGFVHITPAIWVRDRDRLPICLGNADDLADWLGRTCGSLMRSPIVGDRQILELEGLLARVEAAIDAGHLPASLRRDIVAAIARLNGVSVIAAVPDDDRPVPEQPADRRLRILPLLSAELRRV
jgi:hypothetical protein